MGSFSAARVGPVGLAVTDQAADTGFQTWPQLIVARLSPFTGDEASGMSGSRALEAVKLCGRRTMPSSHFVVRALVLLLVVGQGFMKFPDDLTLHAVCSVKHFQSSGSVAPSNMHAGTASAMPNARRC
jgi:hypothetical protein